MIKEKIKRAIGGVALGLAVYSLAAYWPAIGAGAESKARAVEPSFAASPYLLIALDASSPGEAALPEQGQQPGSEEKTADQVYKNIQVFKGLPAAGVMRAMTFFQTALGVDCSHCHVPNELEKDDKPAKQTARKMYQMVRTISKEINTNRVTCYTCHRGRPQPEPPPASSAPSEQQMKQASEDQRPAQEVYQNIQTLKGMPAGRLMLVMSMFAKSLGVDCNHCHVPGEFEKDDKPAKQTARKMLRLTGVIAREYYAGNSPINCYTCHRGQPQPVSVPAAPSGAPPSSSQPKFEAKPPEVKPLASPPSVDQVLNQYVQALGGKAALERVTTRVMKGALVPQGGPNMPLEVYEKAPNKTLTMFRNPAGDNFMGFNGTVGWTRTPETGLRELSGLELEGRKRDAEFYQNLKLKERYPKMTVLGAAKLGDREAYAVEAAPAAGNSETLYFDTQTGLLIRQDTAVETPQGKNTIQTYFEDYREVDGVKLPFAIRRSRPGFNWTYKFDEVKFNVPVDDAKFNKPTTQ